MEPFYQKVNFLDFTINTSFMNNSIDQVKELFDSKRFFQKEVNLHSEHPFQILSTTPWLNFCKGEFYRIINSSKLPKILVIDQEIAVPIFRRIIGMQDLKSLGVKLFYFLDNAEITETNCHYIYLFRSSIKNIQDLTNLFTSGMTDKKWHDYQIKIPSDGNLHSILNIPNLSIVTLKYLLERNLLIHRFNHIQNLKFNIFPMSHDLLSTEQPKIFHNIVANSDRTPLWYLAQAIFQLEQIYGIIPNISCLEKSQDSLLVKKYLEEHSDRLEQKKEQSPNTTFARLTLIDRRDDLLTPFLTHMTFEGILDEFIGINCNIIEIEKKNIAKETKTLKFWNISEKTSEHSKIEISLDDEIYYQLKNVNVCAINKMFVSLILKNDNLTTRIRNSDTSPKEIEKLILKKNKNENLIISYQNLTSHLLETYNSEKFQSYLEAEQDILLQLNPKRSLLFIKELIKLKDPINQVLKLLSLYSQVYGRIESKLFSRIRHSIIQTYGLRYEIPLVNLEMLGMLKSAEFANKCNKFKLIDNSVNINDVGSKSIAYTYGRYAPLSCRQVASLLCEPLKSPSEGLELVCFVGGCTLPEVSACRLLSNKIVVLTTNIFNSNSFIKSIS